MGIVKLRTAERSPKLVGDQPPGCLSLMFQGPTKEALTRRLDLSLDLPDRDHDADASDPPPFRKQRFLRVGTGLQSSTLFGNESAHRRRAS